tara:strand:- start:7075 stop:7749 length:675 start_codon:yes stop_codon:yes gene_type:complete
MSKVLRHPDKEDIIARLISGDSVKEVDNWLKSKYPRKKRLHISYMTLQKFRSENLNLRGEVLEDIKNKRSEVDKASAAAEAKMIIESSSAYQEKISEIVSNEMDVTKRLLEMESLINSRIKYYYDLLNNGGSLREDKIFLEYISALKGIMQDWKKYIEGVADQKIEHNVSVSVINNHAEILKSAVLDVLNEMNPELVGVFIDRVSSRMREMTLDDTRQMGVIDV